MNVDGDRLLVLAESGLSVEGVARELGCTPEEARSGLLEVLGLEESASEAKVNIALELARVARMQSYAWKMLPKDSAKAIELGVRLIEKRLQLGVVKAGLGPVTEAFDKAVASCHWLETADVAAVAAGRQLAEKIDIAVVYGDSQAGTKSLYLVPHLMNVLAALGCTPKAREEIKNAVSGDKGESKLVQLRKLAGGKAA